MKKIVACICTCLHRIAASPSAVPYGTGSRAPRNDVHDRHCEPVGRGNPVPTVKQEKTKAFSLIELLISLIIVSIIVAAFAPVMTKKLKKQTLGVSSKFTVECSIFGAECKLCNKDKCLACFKKCSNREYLNVDSCSCKSCSSLVSNCEVCSNKGCLVCADGFGLNSSGATSCSICPLGKYSLGNTACQNCPNDFLCKNGKKEPCPAGYYCSGGSQKPCSDFGAACVRCTTGGCTNKNCSVFGSCQDCTPTACLASGCPNGVLNGVRCENCPDEFYCVNGSKISCSAFGAGCTRCSQTGCLQCTGVLSDGKCKEAAVADIDCTKFDPYCSDCDSGGCKGCKSGYLNSGKCIQDCKAFGPGCNVCNANGCVSCASGYKQILYKNIKYCTLNFTRPSIPWSDVNHISHYNLVPGLEFFQDTLGKCSSPYAPCCWYFNPKIDSTIVCNHPGAAAVCGTEHLGYSKLADSYVLKQYAIYLNNHQDTTAGLTGTGQDGDVVHAVFQMGLIEQYKLCKDNTSVSSWCVRQADRCCYADSKIPCVCSPFTILGAEYGTNMSLFSQTVGIGVFAPTAAGRVLCFK